MEPIKIKENIYWVGAIDWDIRNFHGYITQQGATYNAYLIMDEKITLIDTVKPQFFDEMVTRLAKVVELEKIDYIISNHVEMDHSGSLPQLKELIPNAKIVTSPKGQQGLNKHYKQDWDFQIVRSGDSLSLGQRNLNFLLTPMVHWPDNMVSYLPEEKILFSNDSFGQHFASSERFDDQLPLQIIMKEAKKYYGNIVLPYGAQVAKALDAALDLDIEVIAPSHGIIWRSHIPEIVDRYKKWAANDADETAIIVYDTMGNSTEKIAYAVQSAFEAKGISTKMFNLKSNHISDVMTEVVEAKYVCVGSPTLNNNMLPTVAAFLTYMKGLSPKNRVGLAFGSYGWGGQSVKQVEDVLKECGFDLLSQVRIQFIPDGDTLDEITERLKGDIS